MTETPHRRALVWLGLAVAAGLAYATTLTIPVWETDTWVLHGLSRQATQAGSLREAYRTYAFILENPKGLSDWFILLSWWATYRLVGPSSFAFHFFGVACHFLAAGLLHGYALRRGMSPRAAAWAALLFVVNPLQQDVISVEAHSQYPMFAVLFFATIAGLDRWRERGSRAALLLALMAYLAALGTKELSFALPPLLLLDIGLEWSRTHPAPGWRARAVASWIVITALALPFLVRPFWVSLFDPSNATSPADAALLRDILRFLHPQVLIRKLFTDLIRFEGIPFASEEAATDWFPTHAALCALVWSGATLARLRERTPLGASVSRAALLIGLGYLPVGFQLSGDNFEKTGELYLATLGASLLLGELLGGKAPKMPAVRTALGALLVAAMLSHLQFLNAWTRSHGERVHGAAQSLLSLLAGTEPGGSVVLVGEEKLDRGAVDAVVLELAQRDALSRPVHWVDGSSSSHVVDACPSGAPELGGHGERFVRWNDATHSFDRLDRAAPLRAALAWRDPDPERVLARHVCITALAPPLLLDTEALLGLEPATILPRL